MSYYYGFKFSTEFPAERHDEFIQFKSDFDTQCKTLSLEYSIRATQELYAPHSRSNPVWIYKGELICFTNKELSTDHKNQIIDLGCNLFGDVDFFEEFEEDDDTDEEES